MDDAMEQVLKTEKSRLERKICSEKRIPRVVLSAAFDILAKLKSEVNGIPTEEEMVDLVQLAGNNKFLRWQFRRNSYEQRRKLLTGPDSKLEALMESSVEATLLKNKKVSKNQLARQAEVYLNVPSFVVVPLARKVIHRVRERHRLYKSAKTAARMFNVYSIPRNDFAVLSKAGILRPSTPAETLKAVGQVLQHLYHVDRRLREPW